MSSPAQAVAPRPGLLSRLLDAPVWEAPFRAFFPLAALSAATMILPWLVAYLEGWAWLMPGGALVWHLHDMVFGFGVAAVGGFLLTALPAWTGTVPLSGAPLAGLAGLWLLARGVALTPDTLPAPVSAGLLLLPTVLIGGRIALLALGRTRGRHAVFGLAAFALIAVHGTFLAVWLDLAPSALIAKAGHAAGSAGVTHPLRWLADLGVVLLVLIHAAVIGRVLPVLGPQALRLSDRDGPLRPDPARARVCTLTLALFAGALAIAPGSAACGWLAWAAAAAQLDRLGSVWIGRAARHSFVHGFYLASLFLSGALVLFGAARLLGLPWLDAAWHAAAAGTLAVGCLTVFGVASRRHTGGTLPLPRSATLAIWLAATGAGLRVAAPFTWDVGLAPALMWAGGLLWSTAFVVFLAGHVRRLLTAPTGHPTPSKGTSA